MSAHPRPRLMTRPKKRPNPRSTATKNSNSKYKDLVITSVITLFLTGFLGEFVIKRNFQIYYEQEALFDDSVTRANESFNEVMRGYNSMIRNRRGATTVTREYVNDNDIVNLERNFAAYEKSVDVWNENHQPIANKILKITGCKSVSDNERETIVTFMGEQIGAENTSHRALFEKEPQFQKQVLETYLAGRDACPTYFITKHRSRDSQHSIHDTLRRIHKQIYGFRNHDFSECKLRHINNQSAYYRACAARFSDEEFAACTLNFDVQTKTGGFCDASGYDKAAFVVQEVEFQKLDFYWDMGNRLMRHYQRSHALRECGNSVGFWAGILKWNCNRLIARHFEK